MKTALFGALMAMLAVIGITAIPAHAQTQTPANVYTTTSPDATGNSPSVINGFSQNVSTGALSILANSPYAARAGSAALAIDVKGRFLFVANGLNSSPNSATSVSMFQIDSSTGALTEVATSPFEAPGLPANASAVALVGEPTGQFLYVGYNTGTTFGLAESVVAAYTIDATHLQLIPFSLEPASGQAGYIASMLVDSHGRNLYIAGSGNNGTGVQVYQINASTGALTLAATRPANIYGDSMAIDPQARFLYYGTGEIEGFIDIWPLSPIDSLPGTTAKSVIVESGMMVNEQFPTSMVIDSTGNYLYALASQFIYTYAIDQTSGNLTLLPNSPLYAPNLTQLVGDPQGPYLYASAAAGQVHAYQINAQTGLPIELLASPFGTGTGVTVGLVFAGTPQSIQGISGPQPAFDSTQEVFSSLLVGATSGTVLDRMVNNGNQPLLISSISISGTNSADFSETDNCPVHGSLIANAFCTISLTFTPSAIGNRQASLVIVDNGPGLSQSVALSGMGINGTPAVTFTPGSVTFSPAILAGTTSAVQNVTITNSGTAPLHVTGVALSGSNPSDFTVTNGCTSPVAIAGNCTLGVTFVPAAAGQRTADIIVSDDAVNAPQSLSLTGVANTPYTVAPSNSSSSTQTIKAGATAQYALAVTPAAGFSGAVQLQCIVPMTAQGVTCSIPQTVQVVNGSAAPFAVSVSTTAASNTVPSASPTSNEPAGFELLACLAALALLVLRKGEAGQWMYPVRPPGTRQHVPAMFALLVVLAIAGCGGHSTGSSGTGSSGSSVSSGTGSTGGSTTNPPVTGTAAGTYSLTVKATSGNTSTTTTLMLTVQ